ncbi:MAG: hypothetical protein OEZ43_11330 [Gammaproteobacteria bacterium]|nr:hypothetical protein [Gammaproteobacteria bacterium]
MYATKMLFDTNTTTGKPTGKHFTGVWRIILALLILSACSGNEPVLFFTSEQLSLTLTTEDIQEAEIKKDLIGNHYVRLHLTPIAQQQVSEFTEKLIGKKVSIAYGDKKLYQNIPLINEMAMMHIAVPAQDETEAQSIADRFR